MKTEMYLPVIETLDDLLKIKDKKIVIGILDWGLGHATRSVPVINRLCVQNDVTIASSGRALTFLQNYFPALKVIEKPGYNIRYSPFLPVAWGLGFQIPAIHAAINKEKKWLKNYLEKHRTDLIISDNCYGFYNQNAFSMIITHQLMLKMPTGSGFLEKMVHENLLRKMGSQGAIPTFIKIIHMNDC